MGVYYNQYDVMPDTGGASAAPSSSAGRPLRTPAKLAEYRARRKRQRRQRVRAY